jgi:O-acetyl-ADP-ribose deacetylase (regulator of RNase III)
MVTIFNPGNFDGIQINTEPIIRVVKGDITLQPVDAIVNPANADLLRGGGVCGAIFDAVEAQGGPQALEYLTNACQAVKYPDSRAGDAYVTPSFGLNATCIIHAVGPVWNLEQPISGERLTLEQWKLAHTLYETYGQLLTVTAARYGSIPKEQIFTVPNAPQNYYSSSIGSQPVIAIPVISLGIHGFQKEIAAHIAIRAIRRFSSVWSEVRLMAASEDSFKILSAAIQDPSDEWFDDAEHWAVSGRICPQCGLDTVSHSYGTQGIHRSMMPHEKVKQGFVRHGSKYGDSAGWGSINTVSYIRECRKCNWREDKPTANYPASLFFPQG